MTPEELQEAQLQATLAQNALLRELNNNLGRHNEAMEALGRRTSENTSLLQAVAEGTRRLGSEIASIHEIIDPRGGTFSRILRDLDEGVRSLASRMNRGY